MARERRSEEREEKRINLLERIVKKCEIVKLNNISNNNKEVLELLFSHFYSYKQ